MTETAQPLSPLMTTAETAANLGISKTRLATMRHTKTGPEFYKLGHRTIRYNRASVDRWIRTIFSRHDPKAPPKP